MSTIPEAIAAIAFGRPVVVLDDEDRETRPTWSCPGLEIAARHRIGGLPPARGRRRRNYRISTRWRSSAGGLSARARAESSGWPTMSCNVIRRAPSASASTPVTRPSRCRK